VGGGRWGPCISEEKERGRKETPRVRSLGMGLLGNWSNFPNNPENGLEGSPIPSYWDGIIGKLLELLLLRAPPDSARTQSPPIPRELFKAKITRFTHLADQLPITVDLPRS
jgi:hypothetical protein